MTENLTDLTLLRIDKRIQLFHFFDDTYNWLDNLMGIEMRMKLKCCAMIIFASVSGQLYAGTLATNTSTDTQNAAKGNSTDTGLNEVVNTVKDAEICPSDAKIFDPEFDKTQSKSKSPARIIQSRDQKWDRYIKLPEGANKLEIKEEKNSSVLVQNIAVLKQIVMEISGFKFEKKLAPPPPMCVQYTQQYQRSKITFTPKNSADTSKDFGSKTYIVGPKENWYLSADMGLSNLKQATWDSQTNKVVEKSKPSSFYISLNYKVGDVVDDSINKSWIDEFSLKLMFKASSTPTDSMGFGIGYETKPATFFIARVWTKDDPSVGGTSTRSTPSNIFCLSFNISKGLDWLKN